MSDTKEKEQKDTKNVRKEEYVDQERREKKRKENE